MYAKPHGMATQSRRVRSTQAEQIPEPVSPRVQPDATAELGGEGGSYGELTQSERSRQEWRGVAPEPQAAPKVTLATLFAILLVIAALVAVTFWAVGA